MLAHYKSWKGLKKWLEGALCDELKGRVSYFLTRYARVHNAYGRAAIELDGKPMVSFTWDKGYDQEADIHRGYEMGIGGYEKIKAHLKGDWDAHCVYSEWDFLASALEFRNLSIQDALKSENYIVRILAILDKRTGQRTLRAILDAREYENDPDWVKLFYRLRMGLRLKSNPKRCPTGQRRCPARFPAPRRIPFFPWAAVFRARVWGIVPAPATWAALLSPNW